MNRVLPGTVALGGTALLLVLVAGGCVRRTLTIRTAPENARVVLNDEEIGTSPVSTDFTWYGDYDVIIRKEGYETLKTNQRIDAPWYQLPVIDLVTEALLPIEFHDRQEFTYTLQPASRPARDQLIEDARKLRERTLFGEE